MKKVFFKRFVFSYADTTDKCPRLGLWIAWDQIVWIGGVLHVGIKCIGVWVLRNKDQ